MTYDLITQALQSAALERFELGAGRRDYTLERVVRVSALGCGATAGIFHAVAGDQIIPIADFGIEAEHRDVLSAVSRSVLDAQEDFLAIQSRNSTSAAAEALRGALFSSALGLAVYGATKVRIGTLSVLKYGGQVSAGSKNRRILLDCVRLLEDALMMRSTAIRDGLTGLYNRRFFDSQIEIEWRRAMRLLLPISFLVVDVDYFKFYNDAVGHPAGDKALRRVADALSDRARRAGDTVCRFGGEEFAMILPSTPPTEAMLLAERIRSDIQGAGIPHPGHPKGAGQVLTVSIGVSAALNHDDLAARSAMDYINLADAALYQAKRGGRNRICMHGEDSPNFS